MPVFVDGVRTTGSFDASIPPEWVEAIEVYTSLTMPPQYGPSRCGAMAIWLRRGGASEPSTDRPLRRVWKGVAAVTGAVALLWLASR